MNDEGRKALVASDNIEEQLNKINSNQDKSHCCLAIIKCLFCGLCSKKKTSDQKAVQFDDVNKNSSKIKSPERENIFIEECSEKSELFSSSKDIILSENAVDVGKTFKSSSSSQSSLNKGLIIDKSKASLTRLHFIESQKRSDDIQAKSEGLELTEFSSQSVQETQVVSLSRQAVAGCDRKTPEGSENPTKKEVLRNSTFQLETQETIISTKNSSVDLKGTSDMSADISHKTMYSLVTDVSG